MTGDQIHKAYAYNVQWRAMVKEVKTQKDLAAAIGVSRAAIAAIYKSSHRFIDPDVLALLADYFACAPHELLVIPPELL